MSEPQLGQTASSEWLLRMAEKEGNGITSVGGLVSRIRRNELGKLIYEATAEYCRNEHLRVPLPVIAWNGLEEKEREMYRVGADAVTNAGVAVRSVLYGFPAHAASLHLTHNQHKAYYETVEQWDKGSEDACRDWVSEEQRGKAIAANDVWELQWYPHTPIGSYCLLACDLGELMMVANEVEVN